MSVDLTSNLDFEGKEIIFANDDLRLENCENLKEGRSFKCRWKLLRGKESSLCWAVNALSPQLEQPTDDLIKLTYLEKNTLQLNARVAKYNHPTSRWKRLLTFLRIRKKAKPFDVVRIQQRAATLERKLLQELKEKRGPEKRKTLEILYRRAVILDQEGKADFLEEALKTLEVDPDTPGLRESYEAHLLNPDPALATTIAKTLFKQKAFSSALPFFLEAENHRGIGDCLFMEEKMEAALEAYKKAPQDPYVEQAIASCTYATSQDLGTAYLLALKSPFDEDLQARLAGEYLQVGQFSEAEAIYQKLHNYYPNRTEYLEALAGLTKRKAVKLQSENKWKEAAALWEKLIASSEMLLSVHGRKDPHYSKLLAAQKQGLLECLLELKRYGEACALYRDLIGADSKSPLRKEYHALLTHLPPEDAIPILRDHLDAYGDAEAKKRLIDALERGLTPETEIAYCDEMLTLDPSRSPEQLLKALERTYAISSDTPAQLARALFRVKEAMSAPDHEFFPAYALAKQTSPQKPSQEWQSLWESVEKRHQSLSGKRRRCTEKMSDAERAATNRLRQSSDSEQDVGAIIRSYSQQLEALAGEAKSLGLGEVLEEKLVKIQLIERALEILGLEINGLKSGRGYLEYLKQLQNNTALSNDGQTYLAEAVPVLEDALARLETIVLRMESTKKALTKNTFTDEAVENVALNLALLMPTPDFHAYLLRAGQLRLMADRLDPILKCEAVETWLNAHRELVSGIEVGRVQLENTPLQVGKNWTPFRDWYTKLPKYNLLFSDLEKAARKWNSKQTAQVRYHIWETREFLKTTTERFEVPKSPPSESSRFGAYEDVTLDKAEAEIRFLTPRSTKS